MFKLHDRLETEIEIENERYDVNTSFNNIICLLDLMNDPTVTETQKIHRGLQLLLGTELALDVKTQAKVFEQLIDIFVHGSEQQDVPVDLEGNVMPVTRGQQTYDLTHDATYIYSSFRQAYGMNLLKEQDKLD